MSVLSPEIHAALAQLLQGLLSPENELRTAAERQLEVEWVAARPDVLLMGLVEQLQESQEPSVSQTISVNLRVMRQNEKADSRSLLWLRYDLSPRFCSVGYLPSRESCQTAANRKNCSWCCSKPRRSLSGQSSSSACRAKGYLMCGIRSAML